MKRSPLPLLLIALPLCLAAMYSAAQGFRYGRQVRMPQNNPPATELIVARLHFGTNGAIGNMGWSHNYPQSDIHLNEFLARATGVDVEEYSFLIVELGSEELFDYPFAYISEPGEMQLTEQEVFNLREYIGRGGFILMDDFDGSAQWSQMHSQILRTFPDRDFVELDIEHPAFSAFMPLEDLQDMSLYVPGGSITYYGLFNDDGQLAIMAGLNNDLANFWDWYANGSMPLAPSTGAFRLGANAVVYALTH
jgi:hypothetical protein